MRWSEVAAATGRIVHPEMQFHAIATPVSGRSSEPSPWTYEPRLGLLSERQAGALVELLQRHTTTPGACWLCIWAGYGYNTAVWMTFSTEPGPSPSPPLQPPGAAEWDELIKHRKMVMLPAREYLLFKGTVLQAQGWQDGPNLWWPDDRAWCVASEIDFVYTYVGGSNELIGDILRHPDLEALPATVDDGINFGSDKVNT